MEDGKMITFLKQYDKGQSWVPSTAQIVKVYLAITAITSQQQKHFYFIFQCKEWIVQNPNMHWEALRFNL